MSYKTMNQTFTSSAGKKIHLWESADQRVPDMTLKSKLLYLYELQICDKRISVNFEASPIRVL
jgi:hypothetical protein